MSGWHNSKHGSFIMNRRGNNSKRDDTSPNWYF